MIRYFSLGLKSTSRTYEAAELLVEIAACSSVKDIEDDSGLVPGVAGVLTAVGDQVLLIGAEVN